MKTGIILQARMGSTRLPGKVMLDLNGRPVLEQVWIRASQIKGIDTTIVATTTKPEDKIIAEWCRSKSVACYRGYDTNVLDRYYNAATLHQLDTIVRITADCPMLDPTVSSQVVELFQKGSWDYVSNVHPPTWPDGLDTEVLSYKALERAWKLAKEPYEREHVTPYLWEFPQPVSCQNLWAKKDYSRHRWTLDTPKDWEWVKFVYQALGDNFGMKDVMRLPAAYTLDRKISL